MVEIPVSVQTILGLLFGGKVVQKYGEKPKSVQSSTNGPRSSNTRDIQKQDSTQNPIYTERNLK